MKGLVQQTLLPRLQEIPGCRANKGATYMLPDPVPFGKVPEEAGAQYRPEI